MRFPADYPYLPEYFLSSRNTSF